MPQPVEIKLRTESRILDVRFDDGSRYELPFEYLRVFSPSAEVKGHGGGEGTLQTGKKYVRITAVEPIGITLSDSCSTTATIRDFTRGAAARAGARAASELVSLSRKMRRRRGWSRRVARGALRADLRSERSSRLQCHLTLKEHHEQHRPHSRFWI